MKYVPNQGPASPSVCHTKEGLQKIVHMHHVFPIPAYDLQGHLIPPIQYHNWLEGAVVELHFELNYWSIGGKGNDPNSHLLC